MVKQSTIKLNVLYSQYNKTCLTHLQSEQGAPCKPIV